TELTTPTAGDGAEQRLRSRPPRRAGTGPSNGYGADHPEGQGTLGWNSFTEVALTAPFRVTIHHVFPDRRSRPDAGAGLSIAAQGAPPHRLHRPYGRPTAHCRPGTRRGWRPPAARTGEPLFTTHSPRRGLRPRPTGRRAVLHR